MLLMNISAIILLLEKRPNPNVSTVELVAYPCCQLYPAFKAWRKPLMICGHSLSSTISVDSPLDCTTSSALSKQPPRHNEKNQTYLNLSSFECFI